MLRYHVVARDILIFLQHWVQVLPTLNKVLWAVYVNSVILVGKTR